MCAYRTLEALAAGHGSDSKPPLVAQALEVVSGFGDLGVKGLGFRGV